jgi:hypothetical protein
MSRVHAVCGPVGGAVLILRHSLAGWPQLEARLASAQVPQDLLLAGSVGDTR